jgi:two-component system sensor histidine kinase KdpD
VVPSIRTTLVGTAVALAAVAAISAVLVPLRAHLSVATAGLVLVVPVVLGVVVGGLVPGVVAVAAGFLAYDVLFIPPYGTLAVGALQNWTALVVYVLVLALVAGVVADQRRARRVATRREAETRRLWQLSETLLAEPDRLPDHVVTTVQEVFGPAWTVLLVAEPGSGTLRCTASAGAAVAPETIAAAAGAAGTPSRLLDDRSTRPAAAGPTAVALVAGDVPVGILVLSAAPVDIHDRRLLATFANQAALALARAELQAQAVRTEVLEETDRARRTLLRSVSHDLRTPLATVKTALSHLREGSVAGSREAELLHLAEAEADRLDRMVANLLDMTRIETGSLVLHRMALDVPDVVAEAVATAGLEPGAVELELEETLPPVDGDPVLLCHALVNLLDNANRVSPGQVTVSAACCDGGVVLAVEDRGPGLDDRQRTVLERAADGLRSCIPSGKPAGPPTGPPARGQAASAGSGRSQTGLGLAIAGSFVAAHGATLRAEPRTGGGTRLAFLLPAVGLPPEPADVDAPSGRAAGRCVGGPTTASLR